ncbi:hypothetical protein [Desulfosarcina widdelii]|uniref:hypothetical protein n=1 Tax=Desulfosarcina widdelii TaxID=947919 RepID=UPI0012D32CDD|nr:hypothetical protein [Desulfosarcina widdelii]
MYNLVRGPLFWLSIAVFIGGTIYQGVRFFLLSKKVSPPYRIALLNLANGPRHQSFFGRIGHFLKMGQYTVLGVHPVTIIVSLIYHLCLVFTPLFLMGHNELINFSLGMSLPALNENTSDILTVVVLLCASYFLTRRIVFKKLRSISSLTDYTVLALATMPFLTGYLAYHQIFNYRTMMLFHIISGELMLAAIPFTKMVHLIFFVFNRFFVINEHTLGQGSRVWS